MTRLNWALMLAEEMSFGTAGIALDWSPPSSERAPRPNHIKLSRKKLLRYLNDDPIRGPRQGIRATLRLLGQKAGISLAG
jgi:hypothetical protein